jgi:hypothetical protein
MIPVCAGRVAHEVKQVITDGSLALAADLHLQMTGRQSGVASGSDEP